MNNDAFYYEGDTVKTRTNNHGGILGGITTGMPLIARLAFKPTPSIAKEQASVDLYRKENTTLRVKGRHDPCVVTRAVPIAEAAHGPGTFRLYHGGKSDDRQKFRTDATGYRQDRCADNRSVQDRAWRHRWKSPSIRKSTLIPVLSDYEGEGSAPQSLRADRRAVRRICQTAVQHYFRCQQIVPEQLSGKEDQTWPTGSRPRLEQTPKLFP